MDSLCLSNMFYIVKQQSYIDLKRTGVETLGDRKHFSLQSTNEAGKSSTDSVILRKLTNVEIIFRAWTKSLKRTKLYFDD